jgi:hypothetical protein
MEGEMNECTCNFCEQVVRMKGFSICVDVSY